MVCYLLERHHPVSYLKLHLSYCHVTSLRYDVHMHQLSSLTEACVESTYTEHNVKSCSVMVSRYYNNGNTALCRVSSVSSHFVISGSHSATSTDAFFKFMNITSNPADCDECQC